jgi:ADP-ribose pyrophosphatase YjhB (NUDIX family)
MVEQAASYVDLGGGHHGLKITMAVARELREKLGIDLLKATTEPDVLKQIIDKISADDAFVFQFLAIVEGKDAADLEAAADGTVLESASTAMVEAIIDFFPDSSPIKKPIRQLMAAVEVNRTASVALIELELQEAISQAFHSEGSDMSQKSGSGEQPE